MRSVRTGVIAVVRDQLLAALCVDTSFRVRVSFDILFDPSVDRECIRMVFLEVCGGLE